MITGVGQSENEERHINTGMRNGKAMSLEQTMLKYSLCVSMCKMLICAYSRVQKTCDCMHRSAGVNKELM